MIEEVDVRIKSRPDRKRHFPSIQDEYERDTQRSKSGQFKKPHDNEYGSRSSFESPFEFRKPSDRSKSDKKLNQFKSSRKSDLYSYSYTQSEVIQSNDGNFSSDSRNSERKMSPELKKQDYKDSSSKGDRVPQETQISRNPNIPKKNTRTKNCPSDASEKCEYCLDQPCNVKYLIVDIGEQVYLSLPNYQSITEGHCLIVPKTHVSSFLSLNENEWREVELFKNELRNMFRVQKKSVIFMETSMNFRYHPHAVLECIPVPEEEGFDAPIYFKKAIQESEAEWAHNIKLIDLTKKVLRHSVPKNLPYFHVEFDPKVHAGFAHVIEEERSFPRNFGKEVLGGMLDIDSNELYKNRKEDPLKKCKEVVEFQKVWKKFKSEDS